MADAVRQLTIRNLIAEREFNTASANQELGRGGWLWDHAARDRELGEAIEAALAALESQAAPEVCKWEEDDDGIWFTMCGSAHQFGSDGPQENSHVYCPYCGRKIEVTP